jgi:hypothetical protein
VGMKDGCQQSGCQLLGGEVRFRRPSQLCLWVLLDYLSCLFGMTLRSKSIDMFASHMNLCICWSNLSHYQYS